METLLIIEDDRGIQKQLKWAFGDYNVVHAFDKATALAALRRYEPKVITLDLGLPPDPDNASEGFETLKEILALAPKAKIVVITGNDEKINALQAIKMGAHDFYHKPIDQDILSVIVSRAFFIANLELENESLKKHSLNHNGFIGHSPKIQRVCELIERIAPTDVSTLLLGESGTGKEVLARAIHDSSGRKDQPFVAINCASIPENLLESELFGYERGAFTGAVKMTKGKVECAEGGTLFLDEIGDMPFSLQAKILRFLQEKVITRIGGRQDIPVNVRIVCATHQNLQEMVAEKSFREDLFYRISEMTINIPPLRERDEDIILIARSVLQANCEQMGKQINGFTEEAIQALIQYPWPGNVRELQNRVKSACIMADGKNITVHDLALPTNQEVVTMDINLKHVREAAEKQAVSRALSISDGNMSNTAGLLGITRPTLYALMEKFSLRK
ncbi:PEP-CTERM-box response regulator transcription factor [Vibrio porteresiae]|uniref:PEP-CTERM-box response regulator transcription factor n=1 Tax=Vibrio porteresiae DSM 19223 TaxID=1123496 RepID=A0ABZ0Q9N7_9VIBR|nr:PEP-CTERM-box response regulator transcription factor [Vibrio porteresiae]WPC72902.1 PEP-CTERM-box response regulator transcription factor [Vibrio porteresiae DSM 19223]